VLQRRSGRLIAEAANYPANRPGPFWVRLAVLETRRNLGGTPLQLDSRTRTYIPKIKKIEQIECCSKITHSVSMYRKKSRQSIHAQACRHIKNSYEDSSNK
jgi:hypothetical protein